MSRPHSNYRAQPAIAPPEVLGQALTPGEADPTLSAGVWPDVPAPDLPSVLAEVDSRALTGNAGKVSLYMPAGPAAQHYVVQVESEGGCILAEITTATRADAVEAYRHPFARPDVPNIFSDAA